MTTMTTKALLFTDIVDSTRLDERLGAAGAAAAWQQHDRRMRDLLRLHRGREIDRSDGCFAIFDDAADAARCALGYHAALAGLGLTARAGLHVGDVVLRAAAADDIAHGAKPLEVDGIAKPYAARIMALAGGGQTLLSDAARRALDAGFAVDSHGHYRLQGIAEPAAIFELVRADAPGAPPADTAKAYRVVRHGDLWQPLRAVRHNLPAERDAFCGRAAELAALARRLDGGSRLVTLLGPAGGGKTRLALRYGRAWLGDWPGGVYFCDLSDARSPDGIHYVVAGALDVPLGKDDPARQLGHVLAGRGRCLVILDNFEQVVTLAPATLGRWLDHAGDAAFLVTSRERLQLPGEDLLPVEPLAVDREAIELFVARARAQNPGFAIDDHNRAAVAEAVRLLDGLPLAIELAAARLRVLTPAQIVERLRDRFQLLAGSAGAAAHQATLKAAIDWSWQLLAPWEQAALAQASVFERGFTLAAAEDVLELSAWAAAPPVIDVVQALVDKSLLRSWRPAGVDAERYEHDEPYFGMYLTIHEYAAARCRAAGAATAQAAEQRHGAHYAQLGGDDAIDALFVHGGVARRRQLALEIDNLVAACRRAAQRADTGTAVACFRAVAQVLELRGPFTLATSLGAEVAALGGIAEPLADALTLTRARLTSLAGRNEDAAGMLEAQLARAEARGLRSLQGAVLGLLGAVNRERGRMADACAQLEAAVAIHAETGRRRLQGSAAGTLAIVHLMLGRYDDARERFEAGLAIAREVGNRRDEGIFLGGYGLTHQYQGHVDEARRAFEQALAVDREVGHPMAEATVLNNLGLMALEQGRSDEARVLYEDALAIHRAVGNRRSESITLSNLGELHAQQGRPAEARACFDPALQIARETGNRSNESFVLQCIGRLLVESGRLDEARSLYDAALLVVRAVSDRREEGGLLADIGLLLLRQGRTDEARGVLRDGEALLRGIDGGYLPSLLCARGLADLAAGDVDAARAALAEAQAASVARAAAAGSPLARRIVELSNALAAHG